MERTGQQEGRDGTGGSHSQIGGDCSHCCRLRYNAIYFVAYDPPAALATTRPVAHLDNALAAVALQKRTYPPGIPFKYTTIRTRSALPDAP